MTRDSDDAEFVYLAFREFMLHLTRHPDCEVAYRNLIITDYMRSSSLAPEYAVWLNKRGIDLTEILRGIIENTIESEGDPFNFDIIFKPGEYGEIDPYSPSDNLGDGSVADSESADVKDGDSAKKSADKIIKFNSSMCGNEVERAHRGSTVNFDNPEIDFGEMLREIIDSEDEADIPDVDVYDGDEGEMSAEEELDFLEELADSSETNDEEYV